jgi:RHS repeat-associated protein
MGHWQKDANGTFIAHNDHLYTTDLLTRADTGAVAWRVVRESFGRALVQEGAQTTYLMRFPGQWEDGVGGFYQNWWREHAQKMGRFHTSDPVEARIVNRFTYSESSPTTGYDPDGLLTRYKNCTLEQIFRITQSEDRIRARLEDCSENCNENLPACVPCKDLKRLRGLLQTMPVNCETGNVCGIEFSGFFGFGRRIEILPKGFDPSRCGCLEATIFHELLHVIYGAHTFQGVPTRKSTPLRPQPFDPVWHFERKCFPCGESNRSTKHWDWSL